MNTVNKNPILSKILSIKEGNHFLKYIVNRLQNDHYRGWHISQQNRYDLNDIETILCEIYQVSGKNYFAIPPGDYSKDEILTDEFKNFQTIVNKVKLKMGRGTINSLKKNFFPDMEKMQFLIREKRPVNKTLPTNFSWKINIKRNRILSRQNF